MRFESAHFRPFDASGSDSWVGEGNHDSEFCLCLFEEDYSKFRLGKRNASYRRLIHSRSKNLRKIPGHRHGEFPLHWEEDTPQP